MEQILLTNGIPKEIVGAILMLYKNTKVKVCSSEGDTDFFDVVAGVLPWDRLGSYLFIISLDYVLRMSIDLMKENCRRYSAQTITVADFADDIVLLANTPAQAEFRLHIVERAAGGIGLHVNADKTVHVL